MWKVSERNRRKIGSWKQFLDFQKKKNFYFFIFSGFSSKGESLPNREGFKKLDINEELWLNNRFNDAY